MTVRQLTIEQKDILIGTEFASNSMFNPIQDINDDWIISNEEADQCAIEWVKTLPEITYVPKPTPVPPFKF